MEYKILSNGVKIPKLGFGVYKIDKEVCESVVLDAIKAGFRLIDTAVRYGNEEEVGKAIKKSGIPRSEFFITNKVWITDALENKAYNSVIDSLNKMGMDYFDLVLVHQPFNDYYGTYRALEKLYKEGKVKAIGVSNFLPDRLVDLCKFNDVVPHINQVETHVFNQQLYAHEIMKQYGVIHQAWGPFAQGKNNLFSNETLVNIGKKYGKSSAQIALKYLLQRDILVVLKTTHYARMVEDLDVFDFYLSEEDMTLIKELDQDTSVFFSHTDPEIIEYLMR